LFVQEFGEAGHFPTILVEWCLSEVEGQVEE
jgi:hypothetical protein